MTRRITALCLALAALMALAAPAAAPAKAKKKAKAPTITKVTPMRLRVGATLTIRGKHFSSKRKRNTVVFRSPSGRSAFAKPTRASRKRLVVRVPVAVARMLGGKASRFKLRVLTGRKFSKFTRKRLSPVLVPSNLGGGPGGGSAGCPGTDYDGDLLSDAREGQIKTDSCLEDTDGDGVEDGFEYQSSLDLNHYPASPPLPYPGKRPYPNALDPSDAMTDYDGDGLAGLWEYTLWQRYSDDGVLRSGRPNTLSNLLYSDGLQRSRIGSDAAPGAALLNWALDEDEDNVLHDGERDGDGDGLGNWDEANGKLMETWWPSKHDGESEPKESKYPDINFLDNDDLPQHDAYATPDIDGDGVPDGADDADHDGVSNQFEVRRPGDWYTDSFFDPFNTVTPGVPDDNFDAGANPWAYTNPFNPCKPFNSERCHQYVPFGSYDDDEVPPVGPDTPGGYPGGGPATPNG